VTDDRRYDIENPTTEEFLAKVPHASERDLAAAFESAASDRTRSNYERLPLLGSPTWHQFS
jgi:acyl-CoA reductase-like NAD-dependent aldehyde dehydrogenase